MKLHLMVSNLKSELNKYNCLNCPLDEICDSMEKNSICSLLNNVEATCKVEYGDRIKIVNMLEFMLENDLDVYDLCAYYDIKREDIMMMDGAEGEVKSIDYREDGVVYYDVDFGDKRIDVNGDLIFTIVEHGDAMFPQF